VTGYRSPAVRSVELISTQYSFAYYTVKTKTS